jgi:hypothetical protein
MTEEKDEDGEEVKAKSLRRFSSLGGRGEWERVKQGRREAGDNKGEDQALEQLYKDGDS